MDFRPKIAKLLTDENVSEGELLELITFAADPKMGDYALPCFRLAGKLKKAPPIIAGEFAARVNKNKPDWLSAAEAVNGYLNIRLDRATLVSLTFAEIEKNGCDWVARTANNKTITIDYSSINIAKPFHIGHLLTTVIGGSLYRIFRYLGYNVVGINHLGDWGTQFGKLICAYKMWGGGDTLSELNRLYVRFHEEADKDESLNDRAREWFKKIEDGDGEALALFHKFKEITLAEVDKVYQMLGVEFDSYDGESFYNDKMQPVVDLLEKKGLLTESEGAKVVDLSAFDMPPCLILKKDGASLYATRDLAAAIYRKQNYEFERNLYVVAYQQNLHFKQVFKVLDLLGFDWANDCIHVPFGMVSLEGAGALSTRKGNVVLLKDVLSAAVDKTLDIILGKNPDLPDKERTAAEVGVGAVIFGALSTSRIKDMVFSLDKALNFDGETGPYIQYTHARCCSVLAKASGSGFDFGDGFVGCESTSADAGFVKSNRTKSNNSACLTCNSADCGKSSVLNIDFNLLIDDETFDVVRLLGAFEGTVENAAEKYEPSIISRYLIDLSQSFNRFYIGHRIVGEDESTMCARLALTACVQKTLKKGLELILLKAPQKM